MPISEVLPPHPHAQRLRSRTTRHTEVIEWALEGRRWFSKVSSDPARVQRERRALTSWAARLGCSPAVLSAHRHQLVLEALPGETLPAPELPPDAWLQAGRWLRAAHDLDGLPVDPLSVASALEKRLRSLVKRAKKVLPPEVLAWCVEQIGAPERLAAHRVWCHRDFTPDNWVWDAERGRLGILDFEHSRPDIAWTDLVRLEASTFHQVPTGREPFYAGYGAPPAPHTRRAHVVWYGVATLTWGLRTGEAHFQRLGTAVLKAEGLPFAPSPAPQSAVPGAVGPVRSRP